MAEFIGFLEDMIYCFAVVGFFVGGIDLMCILGENIPALGKLADKFIDYNLINDPDEESEGDDE